MVPALMAFCAAFSGYGQATDTKTSTIAPAEALFTASHPTALEAFKAAYHTADNSVKYALDAKHIALLWLSKEMTDGDKKLFVILVQEQQLDETGALEACRACAAALHAITFTKTEQG